EIVLHLIAPSQFVHLVEITNALSLDQRRDRPPGDSERACLNDLVFGRNAAVPNDVKPASRIDAESGIYASGPNLRRQQEGLVGGTTVHMHLLTDLPLHFDLNVDWGKHARNSRRCTQHISKELQRARIAV